MEELRTLIDSLGLADVDWELLLRVLLQVFLLSLSAVFSGSETALFSLSRIDLQKLRNSRDKHSESIHAMLDADISRIMTPGPRILFLDADLPVPELIEAFRSYQHPRIPVYQGHWDNVIGFIHSEDILRLVRGGGDLEQVTLDMIIKPAHFVPPTKKVDEMFDYFQANNTRISIVLGEYGEVLGVVTMKDVLTFIFGEITGKMAGSEYYQEEDENSYTVPGDMRLTDFYNLTNFDIEDPVMATIGGVVFRLFDRLPKEGDNLRNEGYEFIVKEVKGLRISKVQVRKIVASDEEPPVVEDEGSEAAMAGEERVEEGIGEPTMTDQEEKAKTQSEEVENELER